MLSVKDGTVAVELTTQTRFSDIQIQAEQLRYTKRRMAELIAFHSGKELEQIAVKDDYFVERRLYPNVDFYSGIIMRAIGIPTEMFTVIFAIGRMPGTLMLSLQGAQVFHKDYPTLILLMALSLAFLIPAYCFRERIYAWIDRPNPTNKAKS